MKAIDKEILLTKHFPTAFLKTYFSKSLKVFSKDFIIRDFKPKEEVLSALEDEKNFILTSKNATQYILQLPIDGDFYCVGETSATLLKDQGKNVVTVQDNAENLAQWLKAHYSQDPLSNNTLVYFCSDIRANILPNALKNNHIPLKEIITYKTLSANVEELKEYDAYVFFSPSGVKSFHQKNKIQPKAVIFAIGETTKTALSEIGYTAVLIPEKPNTDQLFKKIQNYYGH